MLSLLTKFSRWRYYHFSCLAIAILALLALLAFGLVSSHLPSSPLLFKPAPSFSLSDFRTAQTLSSRELLGTPYLLNFWASWCAPCQEEAPVLAAAAKTYGEQVRLIGVAVQDKKSAALKFANQFQKQYFLALDDEDGNIGLDYGIFGVPETFFVDANGIVRAKHTGPLKQAQLESYLKELLDSSL